MIKVKQIEKTCDACPAQWEGVTEDNRPIYVRFRWGGLSIRIGNKGEDIMGAVRGREIIYKQLSDGFDGTLEYETLKNETCKEIQWP